ncbi:conserved membrane hypothetical protein [Mesorhizobium metallidurans STM 2683]|uniref:O-antigen ligase-related domain-containing protein n=1 Tax=Mesorhizobium metallidurans STM 2683 TaxID=1297569 RepID=M5EJR5_9HYPH|nr:conserved membrane hypothetical protein [Mesorhizobium metallidurans STM 2683]
MVSFVFNGGGLWSTLLVALKRRRFNVDRPMVALTVAIYAYCGAIILASIVNNSIVTDAAQLVPLITFLFFPFSYSAWSISQKPTLARIIILSSMAACFGALLLTGIQYYWLGMERVEGGAGNPIVFATVVCLSVMVCMAGALSGIERNRGLLVCAALAGTIAILYSGSRIMWLAMLIAGIAVLLIHRRKLRSRNARRLLLVSGAVGLAIAALGFQIILERAEFLRSDWEALIAHGDHNTALGFRVAMWQIGLDAFREMPFFGHGVRASGALIKQGFLDQFGMDKGFSHFHNGFLTALVEAGIVGALALASIFAVAARNAARVLRMSVDPIERFGATMIVIVVITYLTGGMVGILVGHDILDSVLMIFLVSGTYLASGRTLPTMDEPTPPAASTVVG